MERVSCKLRMVSCESWTEVENSCLESSLSDAGDGLAWKRVGSNSLTVLLWCAWQVYSLEMWFKCAIRAH